MQDYKTPLRQFIEDNFVMGNGKSFGDADSLLKRHIIDSTGVVELVMFLEETWAVTVEDADIVPANLDSLDHLQAFLARKLGA